MVFSLIILFILGVLVPTTLSNLRSANGFTEDNDILSLSSQNATSHLARMVHRKAHIISSRRLASESTCNLTLYTDWLNTKYYGVLAADSNFWRYQTQTDFILTNGLALELAVASCTNRFRLLFKFKAGRSGPVDIQSSYKVMCKSDCLESDSLHQQAMKASGCSCLELSTQETDSSYHILGDWCEENTARLLCTHVGYCGIWNCRIDDFMCPRYEWNKKKIALKGPGTCLRNSAFSLNRNNGSNVVMLIITFYITIYLYYYQLQQIL